MKNFKKKINRRINNLEQRLANLTERLTKDHCKSYPCQNGGTCFNLYDTRCECRENYEGPQCTLDVNECARYAGTDLGCQNGATCINTVGSYECICPEHWTGIHCNRRKVDCLSVPQSEICGQGICVHDNNKDGYSCICNQGWKKDNNSRACTQDVDECQEMRPHCSVDPPVLCVNTPGSFVFPCPAGYRGNGYFCRDIDECEVNNGGCSISPKVECLNTYGSFRCGQCPLGYEDSSICNSNAICVQYPNSPPSCTCKFGFTGNGFGDNGCVPMAPDPCVALFCRNGGTCIRNGTHPYCSCPPGTSPPLCDRTRNGCDPNPCRNGGNCTTMRFGFGFRCTCPRGFIGVRCENQQSTCGGVISTENGTLRYPTDPTATTYQHNSRCAWLIRTNITKVLNITFTSFILNSVMNVDMIGFKSDNSTAHDGFELKWESIDPVIEGIPGCGGIYTAAKGDISSPMDINDGTYKHNLLCDYVIRMQLTQELELNLRNLDLKESSTCKFDAVEKIHPCLLHFFDGTNDFLILENLNDCGYFSSPRQKTNGLNLSRFIMQTLGRFHGMSFIIRDQDPELFKELSTVLKKLIIQIALKLGIEISLIFKLILHFDALSKYYGGTKLKQEERNF
ncbi:hypothetical protein PVAND_016266 [Polypedilum vanderplanki]|uniref:Cubilin n=1 Tax=Polypedilum vanderplanki TaxID=319348 RepID=A0A9J6BF30_POLVA|nr:hypothetical protein PVAND_016266 [Polypedilum vanderplanki]